MEVGGNVMITLVGVASRTALVGMLVPLTLKLTHVTSVD